MRIRPAKQNPLTVVLALTGVLLAGCNSTPQARSTAAAPIAAAPAVTAPPDSFFQKVPERDRSAARAFYKKYIDVRGMPVVAAAQVSDVALQRTYDIVTHVLAGRPDIVKAMVDQRMYLIIIGKDQVYTDMPEYRNSRNPAYLNERVRGTGGYPTSFGEENLLSLPVDRYDDESIGVHEFCHAIDSTLGRMDPTWRTRLRAAYGNAVDKGLFAVTYAGSNAAEYWAEIAQDYFDNNRVNNWNHGPIGRREQLKAYDPVGYDLCRTTFNLSPSQDWRYSWLQKLPNVTPPPAQFKIDPYYTKFTLAREFPVVGRQVSDEAMLKANDTIRKMFAYRHDILKALIADGVKLVVLGPKEHISDLPEVAAIKDPNAADVLSRYLTYTPSLKLLAVGEENVLVDPQGPYVGANQVIRVFADAMYQVTGTRPVDPNFQARQQYELRLQRLDERFDAKLKDLYEQAMAAGKWKATGATAGRAAYWTEGVLAYFDALGQDETPINASHPINTREKLAEYDPGLFALVNETMAYETQVDWRYKPYR